jgi:ABC-type nitrate/sulfonate/bicarbonate transport system permease component
VVRLWPLLPEVLLVALVTFFPMLVALAGRLRRDQARGGTAAAPHGAARCGVFRRGRLLSALPDFVSGLRIAVTYAVVVAIFAEHAGARSGLDIYMVTAKNSFRPDLVPAAVLVSSALTFLLFEAVTTLQPAAMPWRP